MADDVTLPATGAVIAADEVAGKKYQRMKIAHGPDGSATDTSEEAPFPVAAIGGATAEKQTELAALIGAKADASATSDTGSFSLLAFIKRGQEKLTSIAGGIVNIITALGAIGDAAWASGNGSVIALLKTIATAAGDTTTPLPAVGFLSTVAVTPTVEATPDYSAGDVIGGVMMFAGVLRADTKTAYAVALRIAAKIANTAQIDAFIFNANPSASTTTENGAFVLHATDMPKLKGIIKVEAADWTAGGSAASVGYKEARIPLTGAAADDIYVVMVARGPINLGSTSDLLVELSTDQN